MPQGQEVDLAILLDATGLELGLHEAALVIRTNAGSALTVPVDLTVTDSSAAGPKPLQTRLLGNYPDPFNPSTTISFNLARWRACQPGHLRSAWLAGGHPLAGGPAGPGSIMWCGMGRIRGGRALASGVYFYRLETEAGPFTGKMVLAK